MMQTSRIMSSRDVYGVLDENINDLLKACTSNLAANGKTIRQKGPPIHCGPFRRTCCARKGSSIQRRCAWGLCYAFTPETIVIIMVFIWCGPTLFCPRSRSSVRSRRRPPWYRFGKVGEKVELVLLISQRTNKVILTSTWCRQDVFGVAYSFTNAFRMADIDDSITKPFTQIIYVKLISSIFFLKLINKIHA